MKHYFITFWKDSDDWDSGTMENTTSNVHPFIWLKRKKKEEKKHAEKWLNSVHKIVLVNWVELTEKEIKILEKENI